ncbi:MAG: hypothetical protein ABIF77_08480 [bacterium]
MWAIIRRHEIWSNTVKSILISIGFAFQILGFAMYSLARGGQVLESLLVPAVVIGSGFALVLPKAARRCREFDLGLPVSASELWKGHLGALLLVCLIQQAICLLILGGGNLLAISSSSDASTAWFDPVRLLVIPSGCLALAIVLLFGFGARTHRLDLGPSYVARRLAALALAVFLAWLLTWLPPLFGLIPWIIAAFLASLARRSLPAAFSIAQDPPHVVERRLAGETVLAGEGQAAATWIVGPVRSSWSARRLEFWTIHRGLSKGWTTILVGFPLIFVFGLLISGLLEALWTESPIRFTFVMLTAYLLMSTMGTPLGKLTVLESLPISRDRIFAVIVLPTIVSFLAGYGVGRLAVNHLIEPEEVIRYEDCCDGWHVLVPERYWVLASGGEVPVVTSPHGESIESYSLPLVRNRTAVMYNPFTTGPDCSVEFVAWQLSRAVEAVYGERISPEEVRMSYLDQDEDGRVKLRDHGLSLRADHPDWRERPGGPVMPLLIGPSCVLWMIVLGLYLGSLRAGLSPGAIKGRYWGLMVGLLALHLGQFLLAIFNIVELDLVLGLIEQTIRQVGSTGGIVAVFAGNVAITTVAYLVVRRRFRFLEAVSGLDVCF